MSELDHHYWEQRYIQSDTPWDIGRVSAPMRHIIDRLTDKNLRILLPGAGSAWEAGYLLESGFRNITILDWSPAAMARLRKTFPQIEPDMMVTGDFFQHSGSYDIILEQTFFCALDPVLRRRYAEKMHELLAPGGMLTGVLFCFPLTEDGPPFGGDEAEYQALFEERFALDTLEACVFSELPRMGRELYLRATKR